MHASNRWKVTLNCLSRILMFPSTSPRETLRFSGNTIHCSPRDQSLSSLLYSKTKQILKNALRFQRQHQATLNCTLSSRATAVNILRAGKSELLPVLRHSFRNIARSWHLAVNSFIVRCDHELANEWARWSGMKYAGYFFPQRHKKRKYI